MATVRPSIFLLLAALASPLVAQDGEQLFNLYCSACHGADGKGATGGVFPPLAGSNWIAGNPKRTIAIVLHGLHGPVQVSGKTYNLEMPPQGAAIADNQIMAILNYVHSAWGNKGENIPGDLVRTVRAEFESRNEHWTAEELMKLYPLEKQESALKNVVSRVYKGQWDKIPDFNKIEAEGVEEEHSGMLNIAVSGMKDGFGIVWEGDFMAEKDGEHEFFLTADDGARVIINGATIAEIDGTGPMGGKRVQKVKAKLKKGANPFRVEYFEAAGQEGMSFGWKSAPENDWTWVTPTTGEASKEFPDIILTADPGKTAIYRNFIGGTTPRAIGFGFPGGVNMAYSADHLAPELVWAGPFINAGRHWTNRGQGNQPPEGEKVITLTKEQYLPSEAVFKGYALDKDGDPAFKVQIGPQILSDSWKPGATGTLVRTLSLTGGSSNLEIPLGNAAVAGAEKIVLTPGKPVEVTYELK